MRIATGKVVQGKLELDGDSLEEGATVTVLVPEADESFDLTLEEEAANPGRPTQIHVHSAYVSGIECLKTYKEIA
jgi:hypothetical protein